MQIHGDPQLIEAAQQIAPVIREYNEQASANAACLLPCWPRPPSPKNTCPGVKLSPT
jgi:hypothetical protein